MQIFKYGFTAWLVLGTLAVFGQKETGAVQFPDLTPDVRGVAMGNTGTAAPAHAFSIYRNAAAAVFSDKKAAVGYSYTPWLHDLNHSDLHGLAGFYNLDGNQGVVLGARWFRHGRIDLGKEDGTFRPNDWSVEAGYVRKLAPGWSVAATARYIRSDMSAAEDAVAHAVAFDLGVYYRHGLKGNERSYWAVGLQAFNFGTKVDYGYGKYDQVSKIALGGMFRYAVAEDHVLKGELDADCRVIPNTSWTCGMGAEYTGYRLFSLRCGYHWGEENSRLQRYGTVGCGLDYWGVRLDLAYLLPETHSFLKHTWQLGLSYVF